MRISLSGAKDRFDKKASVFLDARKPEEYQEGHISGAMNFYGNELDQFAPGIIPLLTDKNQEIIVYCHGGDCDLSLLVARSLIETGYKRVEIFAGGWPEWKKAGYPVTQGGKP
jgi:rhodanese-related sulfurtransferase